MTVVYSQVRKEHSIFLSYWRPRLGPRYNLLFCLYLPIALCLSFKVILHSKVHQRQLVCLDPYLDAETKCFHEWNCQMVYKVGFSAKDPSLCLRQTVSCRNPSLHKRSMTSEKSKSCREWTLLNSVVCMIAAQRERGLTSVESYYEELHEEEEKQLCHCLSL